MNEVEELKAENAELKKYIERMDKPKIQVIDAEILTLKEENAKLNAIIDSYQPRLQRYKDILQEIREIAEEQINTRMLLADKKSFHKFHGIYVLITKAEEE